MDYSQSLRLTGIQFTQVPLPTNLYGFQKVKQCTLSYIISGISTLEIMQYSGLVL